MSKPELGTKRTCPETGRKFYDLNKDPIVSPYTGTSYPLSFFEASSAPSRGGRVAREEEEETETETVEAADETAETVSLSDVEEDEDTGAKNDADVDVDDDEDTDSGSDDDTFLEEDEDEDDDMTDIIGSREDDED